MNAQLKEALLRITTLESVMGHLSWDQHTQMPEEGANARARELATLAGIHFHELSSPDLKSYVSNLIDIETGRLKDATLTPREVRMLRLLAQDLKRVHALDRAFVERMAELKSQSSAVWEKAKKASDWKLFEPKLAELVEMKRQEARRLGAAPKSDAVYMEWVRGFEPDLEVSEYRRWFEELKRTYVPMIGAICDPMNPKAKSVLDGTWDEKSQLDFCFSVAKEIGYDVRRGRMDLSAHPFSTGSHPTDVRITTRVSTDDFTGCLFSVIHETGHALYTQGLPVEDYGTPLGDAAGTAAHETQSFFWERMIGHTREFWSYFFPKLAEAFPDNLSAVSFDEFMSAILYAERTLIRTEADEVTYPLHVLLRFELELALAREEIRVPDLPAIWNEGMKRYVQVVPKSDREGVLQDCHWSEGLFGYFPSYAVGLMGAAQLFRAMKRSAPGWGEEISKGNFAPVLDWLRTNIHRHGKSKTFTELISGATGKPLDVSEFVAHIRERYRA